MLLFFFKHIFFLKLGVIERTLDSYECPFVQVQIDFFLQFDF